MNNRISFAPRIAFALLVLVTLGCGASSQAVATEAATSAPKAVPTAIPDLSTARIPVYDLPKGFEEIPGEEFDAGFPVADKELQPENVFAYVNGSEFQMVMGMNFLLTEETDRAGFDLALSQPELALREIVRSMNGDNVYQEELTNVLEGVGEGQIAMTMLTDVKDLPMRVNIGLFRRGVVGGMIMSMTMVGQQESISLRELAKLFDKRIQESIAAAQ